MTVVATGAQSRTPSIKWDHPDTQVWVATLDGEYLGMIEFVDGQFAANNTVRSSYNRFPSLYEAKMSLEQG
jgi:hypothetical protein